MGTFILPTFERTLTTTRSNLDEESEEEDPEFNEGTLHSLLSRSTNVWMTVTKEQKETSQKPCKSRHCNQRTNRLSSVTWTKGLS